MGGTSIRTDGDPGRNISAAVAPPHPTQAPTVYGGVRSENPRPNGTHWIGHVALQMTRAAGGC